MSQFELHNRMESDKTDNDALMGPSRLYDDDDDLRRLGKKPVLKVR